MQSSAVGSAFRSWLEALRHSKRTTPVDGARALLAVAYFAVSVAPFMALALVTWLYFCVLAVILDFLKV